MKTFSNTSRVWIYQSNSALSEQQSAWASEQMQAFCKDWTAHNHQLKACGELRYNRFFVLMVDQDEAASASGCSIDKSVALMKEMEKALGIDLFDRVHIAYRDASGEIQSTDRAGFEALLKSGIVNEDTIVFNNLAATKLDLETNWEVKLKESWHQQVFC